MGSDQRHHHGFEAVDTAEGEGSALSGCSLGLEAGVLEVIGEYMGHGLRPHGFQIRRIREWPQPLESGPTKRSEVLRPLGGRPTKPGPARPLIRVILALDLRTAKVLPLQPEFLPGFSCGTW